eukprot:2045769-Amphidinium_carterae.1
MCDGCSTLREQQNFKQTLYSPPHGFIFRVGRKLNFDCFWDCWATDGVRGLETQMTLQKLAACRGFSEYGVRVDCIPQTNFGAQRYLDLFSGCLLVRF